MCTLNLKARSHRASRERVDAFGVNCTLLTHPVLLVFINDVKSRESVLPGSKFFVLMLVLRI